MHPVTDPTEVVRRILVQDCRINQQTNSTVMKNIFYGLITGVLMTTVVNQPVLANNTYSRAKTCYQNQYVETYHPGTREKPGYVSSREERVERPCPKTLHFHGGKSHKHQGGTAPITIQTINRQRQAEKPSSWTLLLRTTIPVWKEASLAVFLVEPWEARSPERTTGSGRFLLGPLAVPWSVVRSMVVEPLTE